MISILDDESLLIRAFRKRTKSSKVLFESYSALHEVYGAVIRSANVSKLHEDLYEKTKASANEIEKGLSDALHTQAFILMTGSAEALLKDIFEDLILENFTKINSISGVSFTIDEVKRILKGDESYEFLSLKFAESTIRQLNGNRNPSEKINFQNVETMKNLLKRTFGVELEESNDEVLRDIHIYWQKRHTLVHSDGIVDDRYINNTSKVGYSVEHKGDRIVISKQVYDEARQNFEALLLGIERSILAKGFSIEGVG